MALTSLQLVWQWPAGRQPDYKLLLNIRDIKRERTGLFNFFKNVESAADYLAWQLPPIDKRLAG